MYVCLSVRFAVDTELVKRKKEKKSTSRQRYFWKRNERREKEERASAKENERERGRERETASERGKKTKQTERIIKEHIKKKAKEKEKETVEVNSARTTLQSGISAMGLITTGFLFLFLFFPQARASASPLSFIHTFGQDNDEEKKFSSHRTHFTRAKKCTEKKERE